MKPTFSIIITFYNQKHLFEETLNSVLSQEQNGYEVIVINDGSKEEDSNWLRNFVDSIDVVRVIDQENTGPGSARNNGINNAKGEYLIFLDGDDLMAKGCLLAFKKAIKSNSNSDVLIGDCEYFGARSEVKRQYVPTFPQLLAYNNIIICAAIKNNFLGDLRFEPSMDRIGLEDWELWISILKKGAKFEHIAQVLFKIRVAENSRTTNTANQKKAEAFEIIYSKHASLAREHIEQLLLENKQLYGGLNTRIGDIILSPYRLLKKLIS